MNTFKSLALAIVGAATSLGFFVSPAAAVVNTYQGMPYQVFLPDNYTPGEQLPVVLYLHGAGERGSNGTSQVNESVAPLISNLKSNYRAILVVPQCPVNDTWAAINNNATHDNWSVGAYHETGGSLGTATSSMTKAIAIFDSVVSQYNGDTTREYITGISMGGYGTWEAIARYSNKFAAAAPLSGGGDLDSVQDIKDTPIWAYHGTGDTIVPDTGTTDMITALRAVQNPNDPAYAEVTLKGGKGHQGWDTFYTDLSDKTSIDWYDYDNSDGEFFYDWLFSQQLVPEPGTIGVLGLAACGLLRRRRLTHGTRQEA